MYVAFYEILYGLVCRYFAGLLLGCLQGVSKEELLSSRYSPVPNHYEESPLVHTLCVVR